MRFFKYALAGVAAIATAGFAVFAYAQMGQGPGTNGMQGGGMGMMHHRMMQNRHANNSQTNEHGGMQGSGGMHGAGMHGMGGGMQGRGTHSGGMHGGMMGRSAGGQPAAPGQAAFGAIAEIVAVLDADSSTDWSKVNIAALREHLIDMNEVTLGANADQRALDNGVEITVTGNGRTLAAIKRMVPAHVSELAASGWDARTEELANGVKLTVTSKDAKQVTKLKALGFMGIMVQGAHHQPHHLVMAKGESVH
jgi:hypothetical protein